MWREGKGEFAGGQRLIDGTRVLLFSGGRPVGRSCRKWTPHTGLGPEQLSCVLPALTQRKATDVPMGRATDKFR